VFAASMAVDHTWNQCGEYFVTTPDRDSGFGAPDQDQAPCFSDWQKPEQRRLDMARCSMTL